MTKLEKLYFLQAGQCFYCGEQVSLDKASVEHLQAKAHKGTDEDANCVMCCKSVNNAFGAMPLKEKISVIKAYHGKLPCPERATLHQPTKAVPTVDGIKVVQQVKAVQEPKADAHPSGCSTDKSLNDLKAMLNKNPKARPRKVKTLLNTMQSFFKFGSEESLHTALQQLVKDKFITISGNDVAYVVQKSKSKK